MSGDGLDALRADGRTSADEMERMAKVTAALRWHYEGADRICDACGGVVFVFKDGETCSKCGADKDDEAAAEIADWLEGT